jgi:hypothetical protein
MDKSSGQAKDNRFCELKKTMKGLPYEPPSSTGKQRINDELFGLHPN